MQICVCLVFVKDTYIRSKQVIVYKCYKNVMCKIKIIKVERALLVHT